jgi:hypothetical protein
VPGAASPPGAVPVAAAGCFSQQGLFKFFSV